MLEIAFASALDVKAEALLVMIGQKNGLGSEGKKLDLLCEGALSHALSRAKGFKGKEGQILGLFVRGPRCPSRVFLVGIGEEDKAETMVFERAGAAASVVMEKERISSAVFVVDKIRGMKPSAAVAAAHLGRGAQLRAWRFDKYFSKEKEENKHFENLSFILSQPAAAKKLFATLEKVNEGVFLARALAAEPANIMTPEAMAGSANALKKHGVKVQVLDKNQMRKLGMGALLAVAQGSEKPPFLVVMRWEGAPKAKDKRPVALIGKGVTFDSGGISLKPSAGMGDMKYDMCGAAAVIGAMKALALRKAKANIVGIVGLVENMPSAQATRPGDIVKSASGKTIEILNTDAEGRLVLADALWYAQKYHKPRCVIDLATLTGAIVISFGHEYAGLFSNDERLATALEKAGKETDELLWRMPMCEAFDKMIDSPVADIKNVGEGREAGSCTAAQFLARFVEKGIVWAHIDIAGTGHGSKDRPLAPKEAYGYGVRLLDRFIAEYAEK